MKIVNYDLFGKNLRRIMKSKKISQIELGKKIGCNSNSISTYVLGKYSPTVIRMQDIAAALDVDVRELLMPEEEWQQN